MTPSPLVARLVPYSFARDNQVLIANQHDDGIEVWYCEASPRPALAELSRVFGTLRLRLLPLQNRKRRLLRRNRSRRLPAANRLLHRTMRSSRI